jgi:hypothetical protein
MNAPKLLLTIEGGVLRACSNGSIEVYIEHMDGLNGVEQVQAHEITNEEMDALLAGRVSSEPKDAGRDDWRIER